MKTKTTKRTPNTKPAATSPAPDHSMICARGNAVKTLYTVWSGLVGLSKLLDNGTEVESWGLAANIEILCDTLMRSYEELQFLEKEWDAAIDKHHAGQPAAT